jgi:hypothetical protein
MSLLKHRGFQVIFTIGIYLLLANHLPLEVHRGFYAFSVFLKDLLLWMLPITVGLFIAHTICSFHRSAPLFVAALILFEGFSNLSSVWFSFGAGHIAADFLPVIQLPTLNMEFSPLLRLPAFKPGWWSAGNGTLVGLVTGFFVLFTKNEGLKLRIERGKEKAQWVLTQVFSRLIPLFILGFIARMHETHILNHLFAHYGLLILALFLTMSAYLLLLMFVSSNGTWKGFLQTAKNLMPAGGIAFTSGCSLSTMPWTIEGASKNLKNPDFAKAIIPATTNIQQIGDCIANTFICFLLYNHFFGHSPSFVTWLNFSIVFVLARFATAAVIGGAIFIMLPIYETYLGFNPEMIAIILAFNVVLDPLITASNVLANGALCRVFEKVWLKVLSLRPIKESKNDSSPKLPV